MPLDITVIILTYNESKHIGRAIDSVKNFAKEIYIIDSYSSDNTLEISRCKGAKTFQNTFVNQAKQFQWAIDNTPINTSWVMRLDADEIIENDLENNIVKIIPHLSSDITGINIDRKHIFMNKWIRFGGRYPLRMLRIWRNGMARVENRWMDEHIVIDNGKTINVKGGFSDHNLNDLSYFINKHNSYATREAIEVLVTKYNLITLEKILSTKSTSFNASFKRSVKEKIYNNLPFGSASLLYFLYRYIILLGFLDGKSGFIYHFMQGYWYRLLVESKVYEYDNAIKNHETSDEKLNELSRLTGYSLK